MFTFIKNKNDNMQFSTSGNFSAKWSKAEQKHPSSSNFLSPPESSKSTRMQTKTHFPHGPANKVSSIKLHGWLIC